MSKKNQATKGEKHCTHSKQDFLGCNGYCVRISCSNRPCRKQMAYIDVCNVDRSVLSEMMEKAESKFQQLDKLKSEKNAGALAALIDEGEWQHVEAESSSDKDKDKAMDPDTLMLFHILKLSTIEHRAKVGEALRMVDSYKDDPSHA